MITYAIDTSLGWLIFWLGVLFFGAWVAALVTIYHVMTDDERIKMRMHEKTKDVELAVERMKVLGSDRSAP